MLLSGMIGKNYGWEFDFLCNYRSFSEGLTPIEFRCEYDKFKCDHNPRFATILILFNIKIFEFTIYNVWHIDNENSPFYDPNRKDDE